MLTSASFLAMFWSIPYAWICVVQAIKSRLQACTPEQCINVTKYIMLLTHIIVARYRDMGAALQVTFKSSKSHSSAQAAVFIWFHSSIEYSSHATGATQVYRTGNMTTGMKLAAMDLLKADVLESVPLEDQLAVSQSWEVSSMTFSGRRTPQNGTAHLAIGILSRCLGLDFLTSTP